MLRFRRRRRRRRRRRHCRCRRLVSPPDSGPWRSSRRRPFRHLPMSWPSIRASMPSNIILHQYPTRFHLGPGSPCLLLLLLSWRNSGSSNISSSNRSTSSRLATRLATRLARLRLLLDARHPCRLRHPVYRSLPLRSVVVQVQVIDRFPVRAQHRYSNHRVEAPFHCHHPVPEPVHRIRPVSRPRAAWLTWKVVLAHYASRAGSDPRHHEPSRR